MKQRDVFDGTSLNKPVVLGLYGYSGSGKTTLMQDLIVALSKKKYRVAAIKKTSHEYSMDTPGSDTWKFKQAGAQLIVFHTGIESTIVIPLPLPVREIIDVISNLQDVDIILCEGSLDGSFPMIRVDKNKPLQTETVFTYDGDINKLLSFITEQLKRRKDSMGQSIELKVNGKPIPLTEFPRDVIKNTIIGMISSLKGVDTIDEVSIMISLKKNR